MCRNAALRVDHLIGMSYNPLSQIYWLGADTGVNYIIGCRADG